MPPVPVTVKSQREAHQGSHGRGSINSSHCFICKFQELWFPPGCDIFNISILYSIWWKFHYCDSRCGENANHCVVRFNSILQTLAKQALCARLRGEVGGLQQPLFSGGDPSSAAATQAARGKQGRRKEELVWAREAGGADSGQLPPPPERLSVPYLLNGNINVMCRGCHHV